jgi:hypothetical protein
MADEITRLSLRRRWCAVPLVVLFAVALGPAVSGCAQEPEEEPIATLMPEPASYAWWLRIRLEPTGKSIRGIPIEKLDPVWERASELTWKTIPDEGLSEFDKVERSAFAKEGWSFAQSGDFNHDGVEDLALVGVFRINPQARGTFVLILTRGIRGHWQKAFLQSRVESASNFIVLSVIADKIIVCECFECDNCSRLTWNAGRQSYVWEDD